MSFMLRIAMVGLLIATFSFSANAQIVKRGTPEEAVALVKKVKQMWVTLGPEKTLQAVNRLTHNLRNKDLYPFIGHTDGYLVGHFVQALRGLNSMDNPDMRGKKIMRSFVNLVKAKGKGWVDYAWINPIRKKIEDKTTYLEALNSEYFVGVGVFKRLDDSQIVE